MPSQFDNQNSPPLPASLRSQRMTADEAKAVIERWQSERFDATGVTDRPAVPDVAEGLDIGVEDVQRLLAEVRERRAEEERSLAYEQELAEIRLAEEERKLAEIQRQRAELRREQGQGERWREQAEPRKAERQEQERRETQSQRFSPHVTPPPAAFTALDEGKLEKKPFGLKWPLTVLVISILVIIWLIFVIYHGG